MAATEATSLTIRIEKKERIGFGSSFLLYSTAMVVDLAQLFLGMIALIPFLGAMIFLMFNTALAITAWLTFFLWYKLLGIGFLDGTFLARKVAVFLGSAFVELTPLGVFPVWTLTVFFLIAIVRAEDKQNS